MCGWKKERSMFFHRPKICDPGPFTITEREVTNNDILSPHNWKYCQGTQMAVLGKHASTNLTSLAIYMAKANWLLKVKSKDCVLWRREKRARFCLLPWKATFYLSALVFATYGTGMSGWKSWTLKGKKNWQKVSRKCHSNNEGGWFCNHLYFSTKGVLTSQLKGRELAYVNFHIRLGFF